MRILAIDPGTTESGWVLWDSRLNVILDKGITNNHELLTMLEEPAEQFLPSSTVLAIEMIASMGMAVGAEVFETVVWIGMFMHAWGYEHVLRITRNQVKVHVCGSSKAKDPNVRQALIDLFPATGGGKTARQIGTAKKPGPLFGMNSHMWPALGVAVTAAHKLNLHETARTPDKRPARRRLPVRPVSVGPVAVARGTGQRKRR